MNMLLPISAFYLLTWFFLILLGGIQEYTGFLPPQIGLAQLGPGLAALAILILFKKKNFQITFISKQTNLKRYFLAAAIPAGVGTIVYFLRSLFPLESHTPEIYSQLSLILLWMPFGALGEEIGWRGFLHKQLNPRMRGLFSSILVGLLWMPIHVTYLTQGFMVVFLLAIWLISLSIVLFALVHDIEFSILVAAIFHLFINLVSLLTFDVLTNPAFWTINASVWVIVAAITVFLKPDIFLTKKSEDKHE